MTFVRLLLGCAALFAVCVSSCSGDSDEPASPSPTVAAQATSTPSAEATTTPPIPAATATTPPPASQTPGSAPGSIENGNVTGTFLEPLPTEPLNTASLGTPDPPAFDAWDRQTVVLYDLEIGIATNYGPGFFAGFSSDGALFGYNNAGVLTVVDLASGEEESFPVSGGLARLVGEHFAVLPAGGGSVLDFNTGMQTPLSEINDPEMRYQVEQRLRPTGGAMLGEGLVLRREDWEAPCAGPSQTESLQCRAEAFEQWWVEELETGASVRQFSAIVAAPAGPHELVIATPPRCTAADGRIGWCEDILGPLRPTLDRANPNPAYGTGTTNIFLVDITTGAAEFVATATYNPYVFYFAMNWPLIANEDYVIWTESFCGQPQGKTRIYDRASGEITELDGSYWVRWHGDFVGIGELSSGAIFDPATLEYVAVAPEGLSDAVWSPDLRYVGVGAVLGHGGHCG